MHKLSLILALLLTFSTTFAQKADFTRWVNPFIGTGGHGHTFPGVAMPFGMVQLSPDTRIDNWDGSSGYHYSDNIIYGFSHTHLSGTGIPDGCDILLMPTVGKVQLQARDGDESINGYASKFSHSNEKAEPGYYSVKLDDGAILAELTSTTRVGLHRYTFSDATEANIIIDLKWRDRSIDSSLARSGPTRVEGYRRSSSWAKDQTVYFVAEFSKPLIRLSSTFDMTGSRGKRPDGSPMQTGLVNGLSFDVSDGKPLLAKVAISYVSIEGARANLEAELPAWDFDRVRADAKTAWNKELSKIEVSGGTDDQTTIFYTALYHTMIHPSVFNDVDGNYRGHDGKVHRLAGYSAPLHDRRATQPLGPAARPLGVRRSSASPEAAGFVGGYAADSRRSRVSYSESSRKSGAFPHTGGHSPKTEGIDGQSPASTRNPQSAIPNPQSHYTVFSLWDTFRATHPLYTIIDQKRTVDFINTFIRIYEQGGRLPVWELWGEETDTMIGYHAVSVIADAMAKGIEGFDYEKAYAAAKHSSELDKFGLDGYKRRGYISSEDENESVSKTLEYAYDDWCVAQMARVMMRRSPGNAAYKSDFDNYSIRAQNFENVFDPSVGFFVPRRNGGFLRPFSPNEVTFHFTEGNSWQYSFFVPHDVTRLSELMGGRAKLAEKLDELFTTDQKLEGRQQPDITGLIGQYAHGNEPSHHIPYLYNPAGQPWKTQSYVRQILDTFYKNSPDGLIGNEDCGQMSAWYVLSASGFYPLTPGHSTYTPGAPLFPEVKYNLENGKSFVIRSPRGSTKDQYLRIVRLNGKPTGGDYLSHETIMAGGVLEFDRAEIPANPDVVPLIGRERLGFVGAPVVEGDRVFSDKTTITMKSTTPDARITFKVAGSDEKLDPSTREYTEPFTIDSTTSIEAVATNPKTGAVSKTVNAQFAKRANDWTAKLLSTYGSQYTGGGDDAIVDGLRGTPNFASGEWQGYWGKPFEAVIDLKQDIQIKSVGGSFLQSAGAWIWMPDRIEFEVSNDGVIFRPVAVIRPNFPREEMTPTAREFVKEISPSIARYVRVRALNFGKIPAWHPGAGGDPWIFVDEILIK